MFFDGCASQRSAAASPSLQRRRSWPGPAARRGPISIYLIVLAAITFIATMAAPETGRQSTAPRNAAQSTSELTDSLDGNPYHRSGQGTEVNSPSGPSNSLFRCNYSLIGVKKFPVRLRREFIATH
jgi:hypothetical protein